MDPIETIDAIFNNLSRQLQCHKDDSYKHLEFARQAMICVVLSQNVYPFNVVETYPENIGLE